MFVVGTVSVAHFLSHVFLLAYPPLFPLLAANFGVSTTQLGLLVTAIYVPQLLLQVPLGVVAIVATPGADLAVAFGLFTPAGFLTVAGFLVVAAGVGVVVIAIRRQ
ncbi:hypothetical protein JCM17823_29570 [Halorubrum gandharaense]